jgi:hypothetical protein
MRLYKPKLFIQGATSGSLMPTSLSESTALHHEFAMSSMLILPDSFGYERNVLLLLWLCILHESSIVCLCREIFLGNTFSSYISVINQYACDLRDVGLTVNIQCANDRVDLHDNRYARTGKLPPANPAKVLPAGSSLDMVVDYPLNQIGNHVYVKLTSVRISALIVILSISPFTAGIAMQIFVVNFVRITGFAWAYRT